MNIILKIARNGLGYAIAGTSWVLAPSIINRSSEQQQKVDEQTKNLELYQFFGCPFCIKTRRIIRKLNLNIITRDAQANNHYRSELLTEGGKIQVPCLKITDNDQTTWLYEANKIIQYLERNFHTLQ